jgi:hypothetical protein
MVLARSIIDLLSTSLYNISGYFLPRTLSMKTASFRTFRDGPGRISIARWAPRGYPAGFRIYKALAPADWSRLPGNRGWVDAATFAAGYAAQLAALDPQQTWDRLHALAAGAEPVLCCWELAGEPCHRRLVAHWFHDTLGLEVPELSLARMDA